MTNNSKSQPPFNRKREIVRVKNPVAGAEFEAVLPSQLAQALHASIPAPMSASALFASAMPPAIDLKAMAEKNRSQIMVVENAIDLETCRMICDYARTQRRHRSGLVNYDNDQNKMLQNNVDPKTRDTYNIAIDGIKNGLLREIFYRTLTRHVEPYFRMQIEWWEEPQLLFYVNGGKYEPHIDAEYWVKNPDGTAGWKRIHDRDISILLYLNDDFTGGKLNFPDHNLKIQPKPGLLVAFPSSKDYKHGAEPTTSGERYVLVSWTAAVGVPRVRPQPPDYPVMRMSEFRSQV